MKRIVGLVTLAIASLALAQQSEWQQCGGQGWTGGTTCASGLVCQYQNDWYSQCLPGTSSSTSTSKSTTSTTKSTSSSTSKSTSTTSTTKTTSTTTTTSTSSTATSSVDTTSHCGQWDSVSAGPYSLNLDLWGESGASSGSQCAHLTSLSGTTVAWTTTWTWTGGSGVKSFTDIQLNQGINKQLSAISSMPSTWQWTYSLTSGSVVDVAYDLFTSSTAGGSGQNEIMIWLDNTNAGPIAQSWDATGKPVPTVTNISLAGYTWNLYTGSNGYNNVFSFLLSNGATLNSFSADINVFLKYLTSNGYFSSSQYLVTAQGGTEPTVGSGTLTTTAYSLVIN